MKIKIDNEIYKLEIIKKATTKNIYIRVKEDMTILITANILTTDNKINEVIMNSIESIKKMIEKTNKKNKFKEAFFYLGKKYDLIYSNADNVIFGNEKVFIGKNLDIDKWMKKQAMVLFKERLDMNYQKFSKKIPYPKLTIRKMTSRWGVCNVRESRVTLNLELMRKDINCLDYVIVHELSHLIHANHSIKFWNLVEENYPNYKNIRKLMKEY